MLYFVCRDFWEWMYPVDGGGENTSEAALGVFILWFCWYIIYYLSMYDYCVIGLLLTVDQLKVLNVINNLLI